MNNPSPFFEEAAKDLLGQFDVQEEAYLTAHNSGNIHSTKYNLVFSHNKYKVEIDFEMGHQNLAEAKCSLPIRPDYSEFTITSNGPWKQLLFRKRPLQVECENPAIINKIEKSYNFIELSALAKRHRFEPTFIGINQAHNFNIQCKFHLLFDEQGKVVKPLAHFFQDLIDIFSHSND